MTHTTVETDTAAEAYLHLLADRGVEYFFANAGTDFASIVEALAKFEALGRHGPAPLAVPHENAAVSMAHGYTMVTGRPQVVMVHVNVGTANGLSALMNAARENVPVIFTAGRTPVSEWGHVGSRNLNIHWAQESFDQATMVREYVKWDYELRDPAQLEQVVDRALEIAMTEPRGPVYLTLPREVLAEPVRTFSYASPARRHAAAAMHPDPDALAHVAAALGRARRPLIITSTVGRHPESVPLLADLAERFALPVVSFRPRYVCLPHDHPMHLGYDPGPLLDEADAVLVLDSDVPWIPLRQRPAEGCRVMHMGCDPLYARYPLRSFPCDVAIAADSRAALPALAQALEQAGAAEPQRVAARREHFAAVRAEQRRGWEGALERARGGAALSAAEVTRAIDAVKDDETIVVNEYPLAYDQIRFSRPGTFFASSPMGGLGWGLGAALGARLAAPERLVIACVGDGAYMFGNPTPCHLVSRSRGLPFLTVVFNNSMWGAVRRATTALHPDGYGARSERLPLAHLDPAPAYDMLVQAHGGHGERVETAEALPGALERAVHAVRVEGRQALLNVICA